jgi:hypothetical protein
VLAPAVWQLQDLTLTGALAARLTDVNLEPLLRRAGINLRSIVVNDAPMAFTGEGLLVYATLVRVHAPWVAPAVAELYGLPTHNPAFTRLQTLAGAYLHSSTFQLNLNCS